MTIEYYRCIPPNKSSLIFMLWYSFYVPIRPQSNTPGFDPAGGPGPSWNPSSRAKLRPMRIC